MDMTGYTKLFGSIIASTIWRESNEIRIVWITMLAMANKDGIVEASVPGLADMSRVTVQQCRDAIVALQQPDPDSRTKDHEGRRIAPVDGGWSILNHGKYRAKMGVDERREYLRLKQQEHRALKKPVNSDVDMSTASTHSESSSDANADSSSKPMNVAPLLVLEGGSDVKKNKAWNPTKEQLRVGAWFNRRPSTPWSEQELRAWRKVQIEDEDLNILEEFYTVKPEGSAKYRRKDILTLLNNWPGEIDKARNFQIEPEGEELESTPQWTPPTGC